jgi:hypothetical protein
MDYGWVLCYLFEPSPTPAQCQLLIALQVTRDAHYLKFWDVPVPVSVNNFSRDRSQQIE